MQTKITEVTIIPIRPREDNNGLVAIASCVIDGQIYLGSLGLFALRNPNKSSKGYKMTYPTRKVGQNSVTIYHPVNDVLHEAILDEVIAKYEELIGSSIADPE